MWAHIVVLFCVTLAYSHTWASAVVVSDTPDVHWLKNRTLDIQVQIIFQNSLEISNETVYVSIIQISTSPQLCCHTALWNLKIKKYCQTHAASIKINIFLHETWQNLTTFRWYCQKKNVTEINCLIFVQYVMYIMQIT